MHADEDGRRPPESATPPGGGRWPADADTALTLNHSGCFDWDLERGYLHLDRSALEVVDIDPEDYDGDPFCFTKRVPAAEAARLEAQVTQAIMSGRPRYGVYFRCRRRDGSIRWTHSQGSIQRDTTGRPYRVIGILRDATEELSQPAARPAPDAERLRQAGVVERTTAALAHARTVEEVLGALERSPGLEQLGAIDVVVGMVEDGRLRLIGDSGTEHPPELVLTRLDDPLPLSEVVRTLTPRYVVSREDFAVRYPHVWPYVESVGASAAAYLPLIAQAGAIGAIGLLYRGRHPFTAEERTLLTALTASIAQSLQRALLFEQEHELAEGLQQAMLPHSLPSVPGLRAAVRYRSARQGRDIGGDWYDVIPLPGGKVAAVVGDVQGHDTHAAAVMGQLRIVLRAYATEGHSASAVMARASVFLNDLDTGRFATCLYAEADPASGWVRMVRAGHLTPLLRRPDGRCRPFPVLGAMPLGLSAYFGQLEYPVTAMEMEPGEMLVMFTDGLVEEPGRDLDDGIGALAERVREMAPPGAAAGDMEALADRLCGRSAQAKGVDDMALVLLHRDATAVSQPGRRLRQRLAAGDPEGLAAVRHMVRSAARSWAAGARADDVELVTDELATNALLHTDGEALVTVYPMAGAEPRVRVEVTDLSSTHPQLRAPADSSQAGRGLLLVDQLADVWGVESRGTGKCVWCEFRGGAPGGGDGDGSDGGPG
ncbi:SpoIIE family protein phosphatase [Streptomyces sp. Z26]|uniref:SpoIIE family protein phosphatase n=1 Tax=Streptomyces sp. Z26 TaxID=2500177 RepID=UPI000EF16028|nr:SpoIIE family protein phosphatase [Streptomyces sp. Z26]RLL69494.1 PAS domain S-box protein [Streptomyces sp. Z26]